MLVTLRDLVSPESFALPDSQNVKALLYLWRKRDQAIDILRPFSVESQPVAPCGALTL